MNLNSRTPGTLRDYRRPTPSTIGRLAGEQESNEKRSVRTCPCNIHPWWCIPGCWFTMAHHMCKMWTGLSFPWTHAGGASFMTHSLGCSLSGRTANENRATLAKMFQRDPLANYRFDRVENFGNVLAVVTSTLETLKVKYSCIPVSWKNCTYEASIIDWWDIVWRSRPWRLVGIRCVESFHIDLDVEPIRTSFH